MPGNVVGVAEIVVIADTTPFEAGLKADTDAAFANVASDADVAGADAGAALSGGFGRGAHDLEEDAARKGDEAGKGFADKLSGHLSKLGNTLSNSGIPGLSSLGKGLSKAGDEAGGKAKGLNDQLSKLGGAALLGVGVAFAGVAYESVKMASNFQQATTSIANTEGISTKAAGAIGAAFLGTAGDSKYSADEMATAFASVSGQLKVTQGSALTTAQTMHVMNAASDLAEAKQIDLGTATTALANTMQAFQIKAKDASSATDILYNASNATGYGVDQLSAQFIKMHSKLGDLGGGLKDFGGLLVALIHDGFSGRAAMTALSGGMTTLLKPNIDLVNAQQAQKVALESLPPKLRGLAEEYKNGTITSEEFTKAGDGLNTAQAAIVKQFTSATDSVTKARESLKAQGITVLDSKDKFVGMGKVIDELKPKFEHMNQIQQLAYATTLFGASAAKQLVKVVNDGPAAYDRATAAVSKSGSAHHAAEVQAKTLATQLQTLKAAADDIFTEFGQVLIPVVEKVGKAFAGATLFVFQHKALLIALGALVGGVLTTVIGVFAVNKMVAFGKSFANATSAVGDLIKKLPFFNDATQAAGDAAVESADEQQGALEDTAATTQDTTTSMSAAIDGLVASFETLGTTVTTAAGTIEDALTALGPASDEAAAQFNVGLDDLGVNAESAAERVGVAMEQIVASAREAAAGVDTATGDMDAAFVGTGTSAGEAAGTVDGALLTERGAMTETAGTATATSAEVDGALATEAGGVGLLGGALTGVLPILAGVVSYLGTDTLLHHTALGGSVLAAADQAYSLIFGHDPTQHGYDLGTTKGTKQLDEFIAKHGGVDEVVKRERERRAEWEHQHGHDAGDQRKEAQQLNIIAGTLLGTRVLPSDIRTLDRAGLGKDIGTEAGDKIAERIMAYLGEVHGKVNEGEVKQLIGTLNIHDAKATANELVRELAWAVHTGRLGKVG